MPAHMRSEISLTQLRYFVAAAERGSMTAAAEDLFIAQSAVSTSIANLEATLGVKLLIRRRAKGLQPTAEGSELLARARNILASVEDAIVALRPEAVAGRLNVGCFRTLAPFYLPPIVSGLIDGHPDLQVHVSELSAEQVGLALAEHAIEIALTYDLGLGPDIAREVLASVPLYAAVASDHPLADRDVVSLGELSDEPMVLLDMPVSRDYFLQTFADHGLRPTVRYRFENFEAVRAMVASGHGFTLLNQHPKREITYSGGRLRRLRIKEAPRPLDLVLARLRDGGAPTRRSELFAAQARLSVSQLAQGADRPDPSPGP